MSRQHQIVVQRARLVEQIHATRRRIGADARQLGADAGIAMIGLAVGKVLARRPWLAALAAALALGLKFLRRP